MRACRDCGRDLGPASPGAENAARVFLAYLIRKYPNTTWERVLLCDACSEADRAEDAT